METRYFAQYDSSDNKVERVMVIETADGASEADGIAICKDIYGNTQNFAECFKTADGTSSTRYNFPSKGFIWDSSNNCYREENGPYASWTLNTSNYQWEAPTPEPAYPDPDVEKCMDYKWDEPNLRWLKNHTLVDGDQNYTQYWDPATSTWKNI